MTVYAHQHFSSSPKVKPLCRWYDIFFKRWWVECRVTEKDNPHWRCGEIYDFREGTLYCKRRVIGKFGKLEYSQPFDSSTLLVEVRNVDNCVY